MDLREGGKVWIGYNWLGIGTSGRASEEGPC